jgi:RNA recognition motif-containing protein
LQEIKKEPKDIEFDPLCLFLTKIHPKANKELIMEIFSNYGIVDVNIVTKQERTFYFLLFDTAEQATNALSCTEQTKKWPRSVLKRAFKTNKTKKNN